MKLNLSKICTGGFTLIELVFTIVLLALGVTAFLTMINNVTKNSADPMLIQQANAIAQSYLEEVLLNPFCDPSFDPDGDPATLCADECLVSACTTTAPNACGGVNEAGGAEAGRSVFDDVCDYHSLTDNSGARDQSGNLISGLGDYNISVNVVDTASATLNGLAGNNGQVVRVDVTVTHDDRSNINIRVSGFKANY